MAKDVVGGERMESSGYMFQDSVSTIWILFFLASRVRVFDPRFTAGSSDKSRFNYQLLGVHARVSSVGYRVGE